MKNKYLAMILLLVLLTSCSSQQTPTPLPTVDLGSSSTQVPADGNVDFSVSAGGVVASGIVMPEQVAKLGFVQGGVLHTVNVKEGEQVTQGQVLAELDNEAIKRDLEQAKRNLNEMISPASQAAASKAVAEARKYLEDQQNKVESLQYPRASDTLIDNTQGEIDLAKEALARASDAYRKVARRADGDSLKAEALVALTKAQMHLNDLIAKYNWYTGKPTENDAELETAEFEYAKNSLKEAEWYLSALKGENIPPEATGSKLLLLEVARQAVSAAQERYDQSILVSPIPGVVSGVNGIAGEIVSPAFTLFIITDTTRLHVETTDLSERDVSSVNVGQKVMVTVKALNVTVPGEVFSISEVADTLGGDVVYKTVIYFDTMPQDLRVGMSVDVEYQSGD